MKHKSSRIIALTILYILIIFGIFVIQFTIGKTFYYTIGAMSVSGRDELDEGGNRTPLLPLHIVSNGLDFYITDQTPVIAKTANNEDIALKVLEYKKTEDSFGVVCSNSVSIDFTSYTSETADTVKISVSMPSDIETVYFPWKLTQSARLERQDDQIFLRYGKNRFVFRGGYGFGNSDDTSEQPHLVLSGAKKTAFYETYIQSQSLDFDSIPRIHIASEEEYDKTKKLFREKALDYFSNVISARNYNEELLTAYIAERAFKGEYSKALAYAPASLLPKEKRTYISSPFYDNLAQNEKSLAAYQRRMLSDIGSAAAKSDISVFSNEGLIPFLINNSRANLIPALEKIAANTNQDALNSFFAAGLLEAAMDYAVYFPNKQNLFMENSEKYEAVLKSSLFSIDDGLYISSDSKTIDTEKTLQTAAILMRYGSSYPEKSSWKAVGRALYSSIFLLGGGSPSLPAVFDIQGDKAKKLGLMANDTLILHAEKLYPAAVRDNPNYPHAESLALKAEPGIWAWTSARAVNVLKNDSKIFSFRISAKTGDSHHLIIRGVRPFYRIQIHGIDFRSDPRFEIYNSSGYVYDERTRTLLLKLKHKKDDEDVILFLGRPPQPAPVPVTPSVQGEAAAAESGEGSVNAENASSDTGDEGLSGSGNE
ncbi:MULTISPECIES: hypothetical protein [unclassified Treponema]|uniref:hypothetical protein n=1 Tax=unclassified Treponema TaxID=2638727 RepID=UPI0020A58F82|nr:MULTISPECIES: hypothetical protein [unclassified Treponema]UTC66204.1 hypothetical protein E4O06_09330 [Treponema sp. OMZ 789]UTC68933.1 hypothetical protein E4O01_09465 [Treponema sp. OMZ 790]UTC71661.1 hypothetical protein E4O02_09655 [Treponema sp. OMZ 791]